MSTHHSSYVATLGGQLSACQAVQARSHQRLSESSSQLEAAVSQAAHSAHLLAEARETERVLRVEVAVLREAEEAHAADTLAAKREHAEITSEMRASEERYAQSERARAALDAQQQATQQQMSLIQQRHAVQLGAEREQHAKASRSMHAQILELREQLADARDAAASGGMAGGGGGAPLHGAAVAATAAAAAAAAGGDAAAGASATGGAVLSMGASPFAAVRESLLLAVIASDGL